MTEPWPKAALIPIRESIAQVEEDLRHIQECERKYDRALSANPIQTAEARGAEKEFLARWESLTPILRRIRANPETGNSARRLIDELIGTGDPHPPSITSRLTPVLEDFLKACMSTAEPSVPAPRSDGVSKPMRIGEAPISATSLEAHAPASKRGPKPNFKRHCEIRAVVRKLEDEGKRPWTEHLQDLLRQLDEDKVPIPKSWSDKKLKKWADAGRQGDKARKVIQYALEQADVLLKSSD